jgi:kojibiose phosphorylase
LTGDEEFFLNRGAEVILATAKFWVSRAEWNDKLHRYEFNNVIGPDEYHDHVDNNAYTNYMVAWHLAKSIEIYDWLASNHPEIAAHLVDRLEISEEHLLEWRQVSSKIFQSWDAETNLIEQFDGYFRLQDVNLSDYDPRSQSMQEILGIEGVSQTQVIKQPDVLMLLYVLADQIDLPTLQANYEYYYPRTDHSYGSSLGPAIQAIVACKLGLHEKAYEHFLRAALMDIKDLRGNTKDGIHAATAGGVWQAITFGFAGLKITQNKWEINPRLPSNWQRLAFKFYFQGKIQEVDITPEGFTVSK